MSWFVANTLAAWAIATGLFAADAPTLLSGYTLTSWTQKDGIPSSLIWSVAQDSVGYLWLGTDSGALRFDGVRFVPWDAVASIPNPSASVRSICISRDGTIWFGLGEPGGVVALHDGVVRSYASAQGLPEGVVMSLVESGDRTLWAGGRFGLFRLSEGGWQRADEGLPSGLVNDLVLEDDALIVGAAAGVYRRGHRDHAFRHVGGPRENARSITRDADSRLWVSDPIAGLRRVDQAGPPGSGHLRGRGSRLMHDSRGNLWVGTGGQGLWRVRPDASGVSARMERTSTATGLSDDGVTQLLEDRDGNIWVATRDGLNRLTPHKMTPITDIGIVSAVDATRDGRVWVGTVDSVVSFSEGRIGSRSSSIPLPHPPLAAMHADGQGTLWVATASELMRVDAERLRPVPLKGMLISELTDMTSDGVGGLWLHDSAHGLLRWRDGALAPGPLPKEFQALSLLACHTDREGRAWFSFDHNRVAVIETSGDVRVYGEPDGLSVGPYRAIHQDRSGGIWLGGDGGLTRFASGTFTTLSASSGMPIQRVTGIVDDDDGALWLAVEAAGLMRLSREEIARALADPSHEVRYSAYDKVDGSAGTSRWFGNRAAVRSADGHLWFVAGRGVTVADPKALAAGKPTDDTARLEDALVDGRPVSLSSMESLPAGAARVQIDYTVLDLTSPQKHRFRFRLDGFDTDWTDAGTQRAAFYTNLPPRSYTFRVMATNADGTFTGDAAEWPFIIRPAFYQTWWFIAASLAAAGSGIGAAWRMHVLRMRRQFALLVGERARLSREVHDTLLQSMFGYALQFDAMAETVSSSAPHLSERLARMRHQVEDDIREARQSIWNLRSPRLENQDLPTTLKDVAGHAVAEADVELTFDLNGTPVRASAQVEEQLLRIGGEAMANVVRHARARGVHMALAYDGRTITLTVADDGCGFDPVARKSTSQHFGLTTMEERAESVGGRLHIASTIGKGTTVTAVVPGA